MTAEQVTAEAAGCVTGGASGAAAGAGCGGDGGLGGGGIWRAAAAFRCGERHRRQGLPCQDYGAVRIAGGGAVLLGAVADGAGSARLSRLGALLLVRTVLERLAAALAARPGSPADTAAARRLFDEALAVALARIGRAAARRSAAPSAFAATLLAVAGGPGWGAAFQIGDGQIVLRAERGPYRLAFPPDRGEYVNETRFATDPEPGRAAQFRLWCEPPAFFALATDGLAGVSVRYRDNRPHDPFFRPLERYMRETAEQAEARRAIRDFLGASRLAERSDDDRTLLLAVRPGSAGPAEAGTEAAG